MNYEKNKTYFFPKKKTLGIILIVVGAMFFFGGFNGSAGLIIFGLLMVAGGIASVYFAKSMSGKELDEVVNAKLKTFNITKRALKKLNLDESEIKYSDPIICDGYFFQNIRTQSWFRIGEDNILRSSNYEITVLFTTEELIHSYSYRFSLTSNEDSEATDEYFYQDVVSISTASDSIQVNSGVKKGQVVSANYEYFRLTTSGGTSMRMSIRNFGDAKLQEKINGLKSLLRVKKGQMK